MEKFILYNPVKLHFGKGVTQKLGKYAPDYGKKALLIYGKGSVKKNGSYDQVIRSLSEAGIEIVEYAGIKPNPVVEDADRAADLGRSEGVDMIVAVGGGSVIDSAKYISLGIPAGHSCWDFATGKRKPAASLPLLGVLTIAATGSEMNMFGVIQSDKEKRKIGYGHPLMFPKHSFLDPSFTISVPADHTAYGIVDLVAHSLEGWFGDGEASLTDRFIVSILKEAVEYGPALIRKPADYRLRAKIMFAATMALNGLTSTGKKSGDWGVHAIGHCMSVLWDIPHGATLSIAFPAWMKLQKERIPERIDRLGREVFGTSGPGKAIEAFENFFSFLGSPLKISETGKGSGNTSQKELVEVMKINKAGGYVHELNEEDYSFLAKEMI